ncbi:MAG: hypothetical protein M3460_18885 [Actinomycetota bacterium]|nr:hypothetical protein [Actinomycetota bacterium]
MKSRNRTVISATCEVHGGCRGYTNLLVSRRERDGSIVLDPHVDGSCVLSLAEDGATALRDTLTEWLPLNKTRPVTAPRSDTAQE